MSEVHINVVKDLVLTRILVYGFAPGDFQSSVNFSPHDPVLMQLTAIRVCQRHCLM